LLDGCFDSTRTIASPTPLADAGFCPVINRSLSITFAAKFAAGMCVAPRSVSVDASKNGTRRWCDMASCGNRAKARRHYLKIKQG